MHSDMEVNKFGRTFHREKPLSDLCSLIVDKIIENGGDMRTVFFRGSYNAIALEVTTTRDTVYKVWKKGVESLRVVK